MAGGGGRHARAGDRQAVDGGRRGRYGVARAVGRRDDGEGGDDAVDA